jgi:hypothetical protein
VIVAKMRAFHAQRFKNAGGSEFAEGLSADALHNLRQQRISGIAVYVLLAWLEVEVLLAGDQIEDIFVLDEIERVAPACQPQQLPLIPQPARVVDQMSDRDGHAEVRQLRNVLAHFVVERDLSFLG